MRAGAATSGVRGRRRRKATRSDILLRRVLPGVAALCAVALMIGLAFAGSPSRIAAGVRIAGIDVGGMRGDDAKALLERRARALARVPVAFSADGRTWRITPARIGLKVDWGAAVETALSETGGAGPFRGFKRLDARLFGEDVNPPASVYAPALDYELDRIARAVNGGHREAEIRLRGYTPVVVEGRSGRELDRHAAARTLVHALSRLVRLPVGLPVVTDAPRVTADDLQPVAAQVRTALSAPVRLALGRTRWRLRRRLIAKLLELPHDGATTLRIGGAGATAWFAALARNVDRPARDADFAVYSSGVKIVPARDGYEVNVLASARAILAAALSPTNRTARLVVAHTHPQRTTAEARSMGIVGLVGSYSTVYGGDPNRIHNVQLVAHLIDKHLIAPGATFSFNQATGARTADKGFKEAPVIINGELQTGLGGGVCQVSTTVFNAAYEAGLAITQRTNHALYISHYPLGRDATVNYPDLDLKFVNDTPHWLLLRTWVGSSSLTVALYGTPQHRRVVSEAQPLHVLAQPPVKRIPDPALAPGETVVEDAGDPAATTSVHRLVYDAHGKLIHDDVWTSNYVASPEVVRVGVRKPEKPKPAQTTSTATTATTTAATTTAPPPQSRP